MQLDLWIMLGGLEKRSECERLIFSHTSKRNMKDNVLYMTDVHNASSVVWLDVAASSLHSEWHRVLARQVLNVVDPTDDRQNRATTVIFSMVFTGLTFDHSLWTIDLAKNYLATIHANKRNLIRTMIIH